MSISARIFSNWQQAVSPRIASTHRERGSPTRNALRCERRLPCSKRAVSILQLWCTLYLCTSRCSTCISTNFGIPEGKMAKKAKKAKKKTGKKKKK
jgi:hypothetical protein